MWKGWCMAASLELARNDAPFPNRARYCHLQFHFGLQKHLHPNVGPNFPRGFTSAPQQVATHSSSIPRSPWPLRRLGASHAALVALHCGGASLVLWIAFELCRCDGLWEVTAMLACLWFAGRYHGHLTKLEAKCHSFAGEQGKDQSHLDWEGSTETGKRWDGILSGNCDREKAWWVEAVWDDLSTTQQEFHCDQPIMYDFIYHTNSESTKHHIKRLSVRPMAEQWIGSQAHGLRGLEREILYSLLFRACEQKAFEREHFVAHVL